MEQLLANGTARSWLLGNVLVTVTVSKRSHPNLICPFCSSEPSESIDTPPKDHELSSGAQKTSETLATSQTTELDDNSLRQDEGAVHESQRTGIENAPAEHHQRFGDESTTTIGQQVTPTKDHSTDTGSAKASVSKEQCAPATQCGCVCQGWAEILVRRPTGNTSWILRLQNRPKHAGSISSTQRLLDQRCPRIYESVIPKQFFGE